MVHEAVGADEGCCAGMDEAAAGTAGTTTDGELAGVLDCAATTGEGEGALGLSDGTAAAGADDDEGCTAGDALDWLSLSPEPPGTVQPMGVHSIPWTLPLPFGAMVLNRSGGTSMLPNAQA